MDLYHYLLSQCIYITFSDSKPTFAYIHINALESICPRGHLLTTTTKKKYPKWNHNTILFSTIPTLVSTEQHWFQSVVCIFCKKHCQCLFMELDMFKCHCISKLFKCYKIPVRKLLMQKWFSFDCSVRVVRARQMA